MRRAGEAQGTYRLQVLELPPHEGGTEFSLTGLTTVQPFVAVELADHSEGALAIRVVEDRPAEVQLVDVENGLGPVHRRRFAEYVTGQEAVQGIVVRQHANVLAAHPATGPESSVIAAITRASLASVQHRPGKSDSS